MTTKANILGVQVDTYLLTEVLRRMEATILADHRLLITHVHVRGLHLAYENQWFREFINSSDIVYCDGMGVKLGARLLGYHIPERYTLADWYPQLIEMAHKNDFSLFFLGNPPGVAELAANNMGKDFPGLQVAGTYHGYFDTNPKGTENQAVIDKINRAQPNILMAGMGMPVQERWLLENWNDLNVNIAISVGAIFEYMAGTMKHGPKWMTQYYMEWLFRLIDRPDRYIKRYLRDNPLLLYRILQQKFFGLPPFFTEN